MSFITKFSARLLVGFRELRKGFVRTLIVWWFILGVGCALLFITKPGPLAHEPYPKLLELLATVLIAGGVFETVVKSFQFSGLFKDELNDFFSEPEFRENQKRLLAEVVHDKANHRAQEEMIVNVLSGKDFLASQKKIVTEVVTDPIFLKNLETKISEIVSRTVYDPAFLEQRKDIENVWRQVTEVLYKSRFKDISKRIAKKVLMTRDDTTSTLELLKLEINKNEKMTDCQPSKASKDQKRLSLDFNFDLQGADKYEVVMVLRKIYNPAVDTVRDFVAGRFVNRPELRVKFPEELCLTFQPVGTRVGAYDDRSDFQTLIWNVYEDLIFPNQGYRLMFSRSE
jgi:hypothetical protein